MVQGASFWQLLYNRKHIRLEAFVRDGVLVDEVLELQPPNVKTCGRSVGEIVRNIIEIQLLGQHAAGRRV